MPRVHSNSTTNKTVVQPIDGVDIHTKEGPGKFFTIDEVKAIGRKALEANERLRRLAERRGETLEELMVMTDKKLSQALPVDQNAKGFRTRVNLISKANARLHEVANTAREDLVQTILAHGGVYKPDFMKEYEIEKSKFRPGLEKALLSQGYVYESAGRLANKAIGTALQVKGFGNKMHLKILRS